MNDILKRISEGIKNGFTYAKKSFVNTLKVIFANASAGPEILSRQNMYIKLLVLMFLVISSSLIFLFVSQEIRILIIIFAMLLGGIAYMMWTEYKVLSGKISFLYARCENAEVANVSVGRVRIGKLTNRYFFNILKNDEPTGNVFSVIRTSELGFVVGSTYCLCFSTDSANNQSLISSVELKNPYFAHTKAATSVSDKQKAVEDLIKKNQETQEKEPQATSNTINLSDIIELKKQKNR